MDYMAKRTNKGPTRSKRWQDGATIECNKIIGYLQNYKELFSETQAWVDQDQIGSERPYLSRYVENSNDLGLPVTLGWLSLVGIGDDSVINTNALQELRHQHYQSDRRLKTVQGFVENLDFMPQATFLGRDPVSPTTVSAFLVVAPAQLPQFDAIRTHSATTYLKNSLQKNNDMHANFLTTPIAEAEAVDLLQLKPIRFTGEVALWGGAIVPDYNPNQASLLPQQRLPRHDM